MFVREVASTTVTARLGSRAPIENRRANETSSGAKDGTAFELSSTPACRLVRISPNKKPGSSISHPVALIAPATALGSTTRPAISPYSLKNVFYSLSRSASRKTNTFKSADPIRSVVDPSPAERSEIVRVERGKVSRRIRIQNSPKAGTVVNIEIEREQSEVHMAPASVQLAKKATTSALRASRPRRLPDSQVTIGRIDTSRFAFFWSR